LLKKQESNTTALEELQSTGESTDILSESFSVKMTQMQIVIKSLGIVLALMAIVYMLRPDIAKRFVVFFQEGRRIYFDAVINCILAAVLFIGARDCRYPLIIFVCGIVFAAEGLLIFGYGPKRTSPILEWSREQSGQLFQFMGLILGAVGVAIFLSA
jgi:uncharacterized protein YjeT (DUF2065 family)